ncbi:UDP-N-acetylmuramoyl-tripeptide--D-alanyl-D-alanine ligase [Desulfatiferula olefinivorans]
MLTDPCPLPWTLDRLLTATCGKRICGSGAMTFTGLSIDSRSIDAGDLFLAVRGQNHDGHRFVGQVLSKGIRGFVVDRNRTEAIDLIRSLPDTVCVAVADTVAALGAMGALQKKESGVRLAAVTGSNGKTSTRAMTDAVLSQAFCTLATRGNFNNEIGLPLTLLRLSADHQWAVVEMGMSAAGEIATLAGLAKPEIGIVTNVAPAHLEGLETIDNVARAKAELIEALPADGRAVLNIDDPRVAAMVSCCPCPVITVGLTDGATVTGQNIRLDRGRVRFDLHIGGKSAPVTLNTSGRFMVSNALAAAGAGLAAGLDIPTIARGLSSFEPVHGRLAIRQSPRGFRVIDDSYNANPGSMAAAIETLIDLKGSGRGVLAVGDMKELGNDSDTLHRSMGAFAAAAGVDGIYGFGDKAALIIEEAVRRGMDAASVFTGTKQDIVAALKDRLGEGDWILVKGSRSMAMEEIVTALMAPNGD